MVTKGDDLHVANGAHADRMAWESINGCIGPRGGGVQRRHRWIGVHETLAEARYATLYEAKEDRLVVAVLLAKAVRAKAAVDTLAERTTGRE